MGDVSLCFPAVLPGLDGAPGRLREGGDAPAAARGPGRAHRGQPAHHRHRQHGGFWCRVGRGPGEDPMPASWWREPGLSLGASQFWTPRVLLPKSHPWRNPPHSRLAGPPGGSVAVRAPPPIFLFGAPGSSHGHPHRRCPEARCPRYPVLSSRPVSPSGRRGSRPGLKLGGRGAPASRARLRVHIHVPTVLPGPTPSEVFPTPRP